MLLSTFIQLRNLYQAAWLERCQEHVGQITLYNISSMWNDIDNHSFIQCNGNCGIMTFEIFNEQIISVNGNKV